MQINARTGEIAKLKNAHKCQKVRFAHFLYLFAFLGVRFFCFFAFGPFCSRPRPVWADADTNNIRRNLAKFQWDLRGG